MYFQKVISKKLKEVFVALLHVTDENNQIRSRVQSRIQIH
jgi:hypothetical protein